MGPNEKITMMKSEGSAIIKLNPKIYPLDVIYSAAYVLIDRAYIKLGGDPETEVIAELRLKESPRGTDSLSKIKLERLEMDFYNELLNYSFYKRQSEKNSNIRTALIQQVLLANSEEDFSMPENQSPAEDESFLNEVDNMEVEDDASKIAIPWEEKNSVADSESPDTLSDEREELEIPWEEEKCEECGECNEESMFDDPEGIAIPWEEKFKDQIDGNQKTDRSE